MISKNKFANAFSIAVLSGTLAVPAFGQGVGVQAGGTDVKVGSRGVKVGVDENDPQRASTNAVSEASVAESRNAQIASWVEIDQKSIIDLAQFGNSRTQTPAVKDLARTIVREHQEFAEQLAKFSAAPASVTSTDADIDRREAVRDSEAATKEAQRDAVRDRDGARTPLENLGDRIGDRVERLADRAERAADATRDAIDRGTMSEQEFRGYRLTRSPWLEIHREITGELDNTARRELEQYQGYEFDASFIGMVIAAHLQQEASLKVLSQHASGDLAEALKSALAKVGQHREQAEAVMNAIKPQR